MCGPLFLTVAGICLLSVGTCVGFLTAALFATGAEPVRLANPKSLDTRRNCRIGLAGSRKPLHPCLLLARRGGSVWAHGGRSACAPPRCRSLSRAAKGRRMKELAIEHNQLGELSDEKLKALFSHVRDIQAKLIDPRTCTD